MAEDVVRQLSALERRVLLALREHETATPEEIRAWGKFRELVEVMNAASWLRAKGLVTMKERVVRTCMLGKREYGRRPLPERKALGVLARADGTLPVEKLRSRARMDEQTVSVALGWLRRKGWAEVRRGPDGPVVTLTAAGRAALNAKGRDEEAIARLAKGPLPQEEIDPHVLRDLRSRQDLLKVRESVRREVSLTDRGRAIAAAGFDVREEVAQLTPDLIRTGRWRNVELRPYDVRAFAPLIQPGKKHILTRYIERIRRTFLAMGFTEIQGDFVQSAFWVFDALFQPQDHPARDQLDTFYLESPRSLPLPDATLVRRVAEVHETGGSTGSDGWRYRWSEEEAKRAVVRPHTTPVTLQYLAAHPDPPQKAFIVGRNFRRDRLDPTHLPEFHQIEGVVMEEGVSLATLIGTIQEFFRRLGLAEVKFRPGYFPYTEPSMEPEVRLPDGTWIELGGSGIFRLEVTQPLGLGAPVAAWGLGLERLAMALEGMTDIRQFYLSDLDWLRNGKALP